MDWDEFSTYMMTVTGDREEQITLIDEKRRKQSMTPHRDMILFLDYVVKERKFVSVRSD